MITKCPKCNGEIQATVNCYLKNVILNDDDTIQSYDVAEDLGLELDINVQVYCENGHTIANY